MILSKTLVLILVLSFNWFRKSLLDYSIFYFFIFIFLMFWILRIDFNPLGTWFLLLSDLTFFMFFFYFPNNTLSYSICNLYIEWISNTYLKVSFFSFFSTFSFFWSILFNWTRKSSIIDFDIEYRFIIVLIEAWIFLNSPLICQ